MIQKTAYLLVAGFLIIGDGLAQGSFDRLSKKRQEAPATPPAEDIFDRLAKQQPVEPSPSEKRDRFQLFNRCKPMVLSVGLSPAAAKIGLTKKSVQAAVESRLRSARLYASEVTSKATTVLSVRVDVAGRAFAIRLGYEKWLYDPRFAVQGGVATTWSLGTIGTHGEDSGYILSSIAELMDRFLVEFLRVNEEACEQRFALPNPRNNE